MSDVEKVSGYRAADGTMHHLKHEAVRHNRMLDFAKSLDEILKAALGPGQTQIEYDADLALALAKYMFDDYDIRRRDVAKNVKEVSGDDGLDMPNPDDN